MNLNWGVKLKKGEQAVTAKVAAETELHVFRVLVLLEQGVCTVITEGKAERARQ